MSEKIYARVTHRFRAPAERVYDAWLQPEMVRRWMGAALREMGLDGDIREVRIDAQVGGEFLFHDRRGAVEARHWGRYLELERPRTIVFTWITDASEESDPSKVTLTIEPAGDGRSCIATIVHEMNRAWLDYVARTEQGWGRMLRAVAVQVE
jgi:uncharacterized protein YndB with AHSA1/START domain